MKKIFGYVVMVLAIAACNSFETNVQPEGKDGMITITATLAPKGAATKAVSEETDKIAVNWAENEEIAILYEVGGNKYNAENAKITAVDGTSGEATITFDVIDTTPDDTPCTIVYPRTAAKDDNSGVKAFVDMLANQNGTLNDDMDVRVGEGTIRVTTSKLNITTQPAAQYAILKLIVKKDDSAIIGPSTPLVIKDGSSNVITTITPGSSTTTVYAAVPAGSSATYNFVVATTGNKYVLTRTATLGAGKAYRQTFTITDADLRYPLAMAKATAEDKNCVIANDGKIYLKASTIPDGDALARVILVSSTGHGLALQLKEGARNLNWSSGTTPTASSYIDDMSASKPFKDIADENYREVTWSLPSEKQWNDMITAAGGYVALRDGFSAVGGDNLDNQRHYNSGGYTHAYWSSTSVGSTSKKTIAFADYQWVTDTSKKWTNALTNSGDSSNRRHVRLVLAF